MYGWDALSKILNNSKNGTTHPPLEWENFLQVLFHYGIGMQTALSFIHGCHPSEHEFRNWILQNKVISTEEENDMIENVLTDEQVQFFNENGYIVLKNVVEKKMCEATCNAIYEHVQMDENDECTWYSESVKQDGLMVNFTNHPTLEKNRNNVFIKKAYQQLYNTTDIYKTIDKVSINLPETDFYKFKGSPLHWDVSLQLPIPNKFQGLLYLTDVKKKGGAFCCVPGFHLQIENWLQTIPPNIPPREYALTALIPKEIPGNAGDFIIWHQALPHCATANNSTTPRLVQYVTYSPKEKTLDATIWK